MLPAQIFQFHHANDLAGWIKDLPDKRGTYIVLIRGGDRLLELAGYFKYHDRLPYQRSGYFLLYTGCALEWGTRVRRHLTGNAFNSNLRCTLGSLEACCQAISRSGIGPWDGDDPDQRLTHWLRRNAVIGISECREPLTLEKAILETEPSPLNIDQRKWDSFGRRLIEIRAEARAEAFRRRTHANTI
jgi:hypothetical protein